MAKKGKIFYSNYTRLRKNGELEKKGKNLQLFNLLRQFSNKNAPFYSVFSFFLAPFPIQIIYKGVDPIQKPIFILLTKGWGFYHEVYGNQ